MSNWKRNESGQLFLANMMPMTNFSNNHLRGARLTFVGLFLCVLASASLHAHAQPASLNQTLTTEDARHLFSRTGFGYSLAQHDQVKGLTRGEAIDAIMQGFNTQPSVAMPAWVVGDAPFHWAKRDMDRAARVRFERDRDQELAQLRQWWISEMLQTPSPQTERMVLFWHDTMATSYRGVDYQSLAMAKQNAMFRRYGLSNFGDLLKALIRDPAMLNYLDNENSKKQSPNENLARELLERFSMGEGNYTEQTVKEAARALTGYSVSHDYNLSFRFDTWKHDRGVKELFGQAGRFDGDDLVDLILAQPATAEFVAGKFWNLLVADSAAPQDSIAQLADQLRASNYDLAKLYKSILMADVFWHADNRIARVKSPITFQVAVARSLEYPKAHWRQIPVTAASLGMNLFAPPNVSGWNEGTAFTTAGRLKLRKSIIDMLLGISDSTTKVAATMSATSVQSAMQPDMASSMMMESAIALTMAAEDYRGPVQYRLELLNNDEPLWKSDELTWAHGHDTLQFGRVNDMSNMPWHQTRINPPIEFIQRASTVRVLFLNDAAGQDGDRNLYVRGVSIRDKWFAASAGSQQSQCVPRNLADAGKLYCNGYVDIPVNNVELTINSRIEEPYQVGNVRVRWGKVGKTNKKSRLELTLETVQTPDQQWRNISIALYADRTGQVDMRIDSYSCWPECFISVVDCLWLDELDGVTHTWVFPLRNAHQCHYQSLEKHEQRLVDAIWMALPSLIDYAASAEGDRRYAPPLKHWKQLLAKQASTITKSRYAQANHRFVINPSLLNGAQPPAIIQAPEVLIESKEQLQRQLALRSLDVFDLLLPGVSARQFPQLDATRQQTLAKQLAAYSRHAISELY